MTMRFATLVVAGLFGILFGVNAMAAEDPVRLEVHFVDESTSSAETRLTMPHTEVEMTAVMGTIREGFTSGIDSPSKPSIYLDVVAKGGATLKFSQAVDGTIYWYPNSTWTSFEQAKRVMGETKVTITARQIDAGCKVVLWLPPAPQYSPPPPRQDTVTNIQMMVVTPCPCEATPAPPANVPQPIGSTCHIDMGQWFLLEWMGGESWIHPDYSFQWKPSTLHPDAIMLLHWELHGVESLEVDTSPHNSSADGTYQPTALLGQFEKGEVPAVRKLTRAQELKNPSGGLEFYLLNEQGVSYFPSRCTPGLEIRWTEDPTFQRAWVYRGSDHWEWRFLPNR